MNFFKIINDFYVGLAVELDHTIGTIESNRSSTSKSCRIFQNFTNEDDEGVPSMGSSIHVYHVIGPVQNLSNCHHLQIGIDVWMLGCLAFVSVTILIYTVIAFQVHYKKRKRKLSTYRYCDITCGILYFSGLLAVHFFVLSLLCQVMLKPSAGRLRRFWE